MPNKVDKTKTDASPLLTENLSGLPSAFVITAEFDPLKDEGFAYYQKLKQAGVEVKFKELKGVLHVAQGPFMDEVIDELNTEIAAELKKVFK